MIVALLIAAFAILVWKLSRVDGPFEFIDLFLDQQNNRASLAKILLIWLLALSTWVIVVKVTGIYKAEGIESLLLGLVTVFVGQITVLAAIDRWKNNTPTETPPPPPPLPEPPKEPDDK